MWMQVKIVRKSIIQGVKMRLGKGAFVLSYKNV